MTQDPLRTSSVHRSTSDRAVPEGTTHNPWKPAVRETDMPDLLLDHLVSGGLAVAASPLPPRQPLQLPPNCVDRTAARIGTITVTVGAT
jgi:hypothetical protein